MREKLWFLGRKSWEMSVVKGLACDEESRCAQWLKLVSHEAGCESHPTAQDASTIPHRWAPYWLGCRSESHGVECVEKRLSMHASFTFTMGEGGRMLTYWSNWFCLRCTCQAQAAREVGCVLVWMQKREAQCEAWREEMSKRMWLLLAAEEGGEMRSDWRVWC